MSDKENYLLTILLFPIKERTMIPNNNDPSVSSEKKTLPK